MRIYVLLAVIVAAGCSHLNYSVKSKPPPTFDDDASNVVVAQKHGWKIIEQNGASFFCRGDSVTGSRVRSRTICMTPDEWREFARRSERNAVEGIHGRQPCLAPACSSGG